MMKNYRTSDPKEKKKKRKKSEIEAMIAQIVEKSLKATVD